MNPGCPFTRFLTLLVAGLLFDPGAGAQLITQNVTLQPGWNSIWLEVQPTNSSVHRVLAGVPLESVWTYKARLSSVEFIEDTDEPVWNRSRWLVFVPTNRVESFQNNLFALHANRPYLIHVTNTSPVTWSVTGTPSHRPLEWVPDAYNLLGFPVDPGLVPSFGEYFQRAPAQFDSTQSRMRGAYRLNAAGEWVAVSASESIQRGIAYWVFSQGPSAFTAPLEVSLLHGDRLAFGTSLDELSIRLRNAGPASRQVFVRDLTAPSKLSYYQFSTNTALTWPSLPANLALTLGPGATMDLRLAIRRRDFTSENYTSLLTLSDAEGTLFRIPVAARALLPAGAGDALAEARNHAGLWAGTVRLTAVAEVNSGLLQTNPLTREVTRTSGSTNPTPTRGELNMRILLHVDTNGVTRLLREVVQMWKDGTYTNDPSGYRRTAEPGRFVLVTRPALLSQFGGATIRDGQPVGRRLSTASYDFDGGTNNVAVLTGLFAISNQLSGTLSLASTAPTNPFRHKYHPDHDNLDATFRNFVEEAYPVTRHIELFFTGADPSGGASTRYGYDILGGTYRERIDGLHRENLHVSGVFRLSRVAITGVLNQ